MSDDPLGLDPMTYSVMSKCHHANNAARQAMQKARKAEILRLCALLAGAMPGSSGIALGRTRYGRCRYEALLQDSL